MWNIQFLYSGLLCFCLIHVHKCHSLEGSATIKVQYLEADSVIDYQPKLRHRGFFNSDLRIYCFRGETKTLARYFETIELQLEIEGDDFLQYDGTTPAEVEDHHSERRSLFSFNLFTQRKTRLQLSPFEQRCIGIETEQAYRVRLHQVRIDFWRVIQITVGLMLFLSADSLSHNAMFYYITGVALGICCSFMLLVWLAGKLIPKRPMMYGVLLGGWTVGIYIIQMLWENLQLIVVTYRTYVFWYILITGLLSFFFCYRLGPPRNKRSKNIVKWLLQVMSLMMVYFSSHYEEASAAFILFAIIYYYFPRTIIYRMYGVYLRKFPAKRRLLTNEEYYEEGVRETEKALKELRTYARSPDCKQWKMMSKLRDPLRFADFVEGASHLQDAEILNFECFRNESEDDDDGDVDGDSEISMGNFEEPNTSQRPNKRGYMQHSQQYKKPSINRRSQAVQRGEDGNNSDEDENDYSDEAAEDEQNIYDIATTSYNTRRYNTPPVLNGNRRRLTAYDSNVVRSAPTTSGVRRSAKMVALAHKQLQEQQQRRKGSTRSGSIRRSFEMHNYNGEC